MGNEDDYLLVQVSGPALASGSRVALVGASLLAGRGAEAQLRIGDQQVSRLHFELLRVARAAGERGWMICDLQSTNGTFVNGDRLGSGECRLLMPGDTVRAGHCSWKVETAQGAASLPAPAARHAPIAQAVPPSPERRGTERQGRVVQAAAQAPASAVLVAGPTPAAEVGAGEPASAAGAAREPAAAAGSAATGAVTAVPAWQWVVSLLLGVGVLALVVSVFLPWIRVEVQLKIATALREAPAGELLSGLLSEAEKLLGVEGVPLIQQPASMTINGQDVQAELLLVPVVLILVLLAVDLALKLGRSSLPGLGYLAIVLIPGAIMLVELRSHISQAGQPVLFGRSVLDLIRGATEVVETQVVALAGAYLAGAGVLLLLLGGILRVVMPVAERGGDAGAAGRHAAGRTGRRAADAVHE